MTRFGLPNGLDAIARLRDEMDKVFANVLREVPSLGSAIPSILESQPRLNMWEDESTLFVEAEVPGLKLQELDVYAKDDELTIAGDRSAPEQAESDFRTRERAHTKFRRVVRLPVPINPELIEARLQQGILTLTMPKAECAKPKKIDVKLG
ncbi:Alpha-crystallin [Planctomycetes bacterium Pan216]|uniref:Alpha-crystallin n=1 Tax=Kolteria novifilia TaxID=2527975 RepID=A0A518B1R0_9BACT|nr:Alpha-crystallin [Planctomycetes bacterium Pan216]